MTETHTLPKNMDRYGDLVRKRSDLEGRLRKAENEKNSVKPGIYERVRKEYEGMLEGVLKELIPLQAEIDGSLREWSQQLRDIESRAKEIHDKLEEMEFRHRVGEFETDHYMKLETTLKKQFAELTQQGGEFRSLLEQVEAAKVGSRTTAGSGSPQEPARPGPEAAPRRPMPSERPPIITPQPSNTGPAVTPSKRPAAWPAAKAPEPTPVPVGKAPDPSPATSRQISQPETDDVIDISSWTTEFKRDRSAKPVGPPMKKPAVDRTPQSPPKPRTAPAPSADRAPTPSSTAAAMGESLAVQAGFPVLIIVGGPGAGKKLPLVPMTMTVGREHDNNIELKDEDVARYHARISFQRGQYILQDLESSSGTWVNDERISEAILKQGDKIRVGATEMVIDFE